MDTLVLETNEKGDLVIVGTRTRRREVLVELALVTMSGISSVGLTTQQVRAVAAGLLDAVHRALEET